jgi:hypothetical protein
MTLRNTMLTEPRICLQIKSALDTWQTAQSQTCHKDGPLHTQVDSAVQAHAQLRMQEASALVWTPLPSDPWHAPCTPEPPHHLHRMSNYPMLSHSASVRANHMSPSATSDVCLHSSNAHISPTMEAQAGRHSGAGRPGCNRSSSGSCARNVAVFVTACAHPLLGPKPIGAVLAQGYAPSSLPMDVCARYLHHFLPSLSA